MVLISDYWQGAVSSLEPDTRSYLQQWILLREVPHPPPISWKVTHRQLGRLHTRWMAGMKGGTETCPGSVDLTGSWVGGYLEGENICNWLFLVGQLQACLSQSQDVQVFPSCSMCHSGETQKPLQGWEVLKEKQLCPGKWHVLSGDKWFFWGLDKQLACLVPLCAPGGSRAGKNWWPQPGKGIW